MGKGLGFETRRFRATHVGRTSGPSRRTGSPSYPLRTPWGNRWWAVPTIRATSSTCWAELRPRGNPGRSKRPRASPRAGTPRGSPWCLRANSRPGPCFLLAQPPTIRHGVIPTHVHHGMVIILLETGIPPSVLRVTPEHSLRFVPPKAAVSVFLRIRLIPCVVNETTELPSRHLVYTQIERSCDLDPMLLLIVKTIFLVFRAAHQELAGGNQHQLHADGVGDDFRRRGRCLIRCTGRVGALAIAGGQNGGPERQIRDGRVSHSSPPGEKRLLPQTTIFRIRLAGRENKPTSAVRGRMGRMESGNRAVRKRAARASRGARFQRAWHDGIEAHVGLRPWQSRDRTAGKPAR